MGSHFISLILFQGIQGTLEIRSASDQPHAADFRRTAEPAAFSSVVLELLHIDLQEVSRRFNLPLGFEKAFSQEVRLLG